MTITSSLRVFLDFGGSGLLCAVATAAAALVCMYLLHIRTNSIIKQSLHVALIIGWSVVETFTFVEIVIKSKGQESVLA